MTYPHPLPVDAEVILLHAAGCATDDILRLARLRGHVERGEVVELTMEFRRQAFERWSFQHGRRGVGDSGASL